MRCQYKLSRWTNCVLFIGCWESLNCSKKGVVMDNPKVVKKIAIMKAHM
jgi:hypothetical protein